MRGPGEPSTTLVTLLEFASELASLAQSHPSPSTLHAWGVAQLLLGGSSVDAAVATLEAAASLRPDASVYSDLSAAYLESARRNRDTPRLEAGLRAAEAALRLEPKAAEAAFNHALILEELGEWERAEGAWQALSREDRGDGWGAEVTRRLDLVRRRRGTAPRVGGPS
jgi:tetratricopeptide (TPR) repeat protein